MTEVTSVLEAAKEAHTESVARTERDAAAKVEELSPVITGLLAKVLDLDADHKSLSDMVWVASTAEEQTAKDVLAEPMLSVGVESVLEGVAVRAVLREVPNSPSPVKAQFLVNTVKKGGSWDVDARDWKPFDSLAALGAVLA